MKKVLRQILVFMSVFFLLCSCSIKNDNEITIKKDGSMKYNILIAFDNELVEGLNLFENENNKGDKVVGVTNIINENIKDMHLDGFKKEEYSDTYYTGNMYSYDVDNIDKISSDKTDPVYINGKEDNKIVDQKLFSKTNNVYSASFIYNLENKEMYENISFENVFKVSLPTKNLNNNADKVVNNGKTLVWYIKNGEQKKIDFSFKLIDYKYAYISIGSIAFDILIIVAFILLFKKERVKL